MRNIMMSLPKGVNADAVSTTISPVTHTALVAVKSASTQPIGWELEIGRDNKKVPAIIRKIKLPAKGCAGL